MKTNFKSLILNYIFIIFLTLSFVVLPKVYAKFNPTINHIKKTANKMIPYIEREVGKSFIHRTKFKEISPKSLYKIIIKENTSSIKGLSTKLKSSELNIISKKAAYIGSKYYLALYSLVSWDIYIVSKNINKYMHKYKLSNNQKEELLSLIITHELVHALDDQYFGILSTFKSIDNYDSYQSFSSIVEGHAEYVVERIANKLGYNDVLKYYYEFISEYSDDPEIDSYIKYLEFTYHKGKDFFEYIENKNGYVSTSTLKHIFVNPPNKTLLIHFPEKYFENYVPPNINFEQVFEDIKQFLPKENWYNENDKIGEFALRMMLQSEMTSDQMNNLLKNFVDGQIITFRSNENQILTISIVVFHTENSANLFYSTYQNIYSNKIQSLNNDKNIFIEDIKEEYVTIPETTNSKLFEYRLSYDNTNFFHYRIVLSKTSFIVIELNMINFEMGSMFYTNLINYILNKISLENR